MAYVLLFCVGIGCGHSEGRMGSESLEGQSQEQRRNQEFSGQLCGPLLHRPRLKCLKLHLAG